MEISKPVGIAIAAVTAVVMVGLVGWLAFGRGGSASATPNTVGVPAVASPAVAPPDAGSVGVNIPGQTGPEGAVLPPGAIPP